MTTINPMRPFGTNAVVVKSDINDAWTYLGAAGHYKTADLAAALGLVTREDFDRLLEAREKANAALRAELDELNNNPWKARCQEERNELDEAKATIARVRHLRDVSGDTVGVEELDAALDPKPAFVLPTEAGARFEAKVARQGCGPQGELAEFTTYIGPDGPVYHRNLGALPGKLRTAEEVMADFTGHRLIGAES